MIEIKLNLNKTECRFDDDDDIGDKEGSIEGILVRGLFLVGASWNESKNIITGEATFDNKIYCEMPVFR